MLGFGFDVPARAVRGGAPYNPVSALGSDLVELWDASRYDLMTDDGSGVISSWRGVKSAYNATAATTARPTYNATSFNGAPGVTFDGAANVMTCTDAGLLAALPDGAEAGELWAVISQTALAADTTARYAVSYGAANTTQRVIARVVASATNRGGVRTGSGSSLLAVQETTIDLSSRHVMRAVFGATESTIRVGSSTSSPVAAVPSTTNTRFRIGATSVSTAANFWQGQVRLVAATLPLSTQKAADFTSYLNSMV